MKIRRSDERGYFDHGWLKTYHTFSFADYVDPAFMGYRSLRVLNEDRVSPDRGFGRHGHRDMEIVTWVLEGQLAHGDSMGTGSIIRPGDVQRMSAGTGVMHSEENPSSTERVHFLQIWILPEKVGIDPGYEQKATGIADRPNELIRIAGPERSAAGVRIHQDAGIYAARLREASVRHELEADRFGWIQLARGSAEVNGEILEQGDGASFEAGEAIEVRAGSETAEVLVFDLA